MRVRRRVDHLSDEHGFPKFGAGGGTGTISSWPFSVHPSRWSNYLELVTLLQPPSAI